MDHHRPKTKQMLFRCCSIPSIAETVTGLCMCVAGVSVSGTLTDTVEGLKTIITICAWKEDYTIILLLSKMQYVFNTTFKPQQHCSTLIPASHTHTHTHTHTVLVSRESPHNYSLKNRFRPALPFRPCYWRRVGNPPAGLQTPSGPPSSLSSWSWCPMETWEDCSPLRVGREMITNENKEREKIEDIMFGWACVKQADLWLRVWGSVGARCCCRPWGARRSCVALGEMSQAYYLSD